MIREATLEESAAIAALSIQVWLDTYATEGICSKISAFVLSEFTREKISEKIRSKEYLYLVEMVEGNLLGFALIHFNARCPLESITAPELDKLYVQERFTAKGVGSALLDAAVACCRRLSHKQLWLRVYHGNSRAIGFYGRHGFEKIGSTWFELENERHENYLLSKPIE